MQQFRQRHFKWFPVCLQAAVINLAAERIAASSGCGDARSANEMMDRLGMDRRSAVSTNSRASTLMFPELWAVGE